MEQNKCQERFPDKIRIVAFGFIFGSLSKLVVADDVRGSSSRVVHESHFEYCQPLSEIYEITVHSSNNIPSIALYFIWGKRKRHAGSIFSRMNETEFIMNIAP